MEKNQGEKRYRSPLANMIFFNSTINHGVTGEKLEKKQSPSFCQFVGTC
jgi:hypothetical protein